MVIRKLFLLALLLGFAGLPGCGSDETPAPTKPGGLVVGDKAAPFALLDQKGQVIKLSDVDKDWYLVLLFYRGHWCSACLNQLLDMKKDLPRFTALRTAVMTVSVDPVEDSAHFNEEWRFPFPMLSDPKLRLIDAYGARHPQGHEGKDISKPGVLIIDPQRIVRFKYIGTSPVDRPTNDEILFQIEQFEKTTPKAH